MGLNEYYRSNWNSLGIQWNSWGMDPIKYISIRYDGCRADCLYRFDVSVACGTVYRITKTDFAEGTKRKLQRDAMRLQWFCFQCSTNLMLHLRCTMKHEWWLSPGLRNCTSILLNHNCILYLPSQMINQFTCLKEFWNGKRSILLFTATIKNMIKKKEPQEKMWLSIQYIK